MQWQKKLYQHEELPPPGIWDEMIKVLADEPYQIRQSLNEYTATPPDKVWENITFQIEKKDTPASVSFLHKFRRTTLSYAAAITGIGLFTALLVFLLNNKPNEVGVKDLAAGLNFQDSPLLENNNTDTNQDLEKNLTLNKPAEGSLNSENQPGNAASKNDELKKEDITPVKVNPVIASIKKPHAPIGLKTNPKEPEQKISSKKVSYSDGNYILMYENNGQANRVSYKLAEMVQSLNSNELAPGNSKESAQLWQKKITEWKEKMGHSTFIPSASNFFDIAEMAEILNAEQ
jgi:hypothetical protein